MEGFGAIVLAIVGWIIFNYVINAGAKTVKAAGKAVMGNGSFSENLDLQFKGMEAMKVRLTDSSLHEDGEGPVIKGVEVKGLFPVNKKVSVGFITSVFDDVDGELEPVISVIDQFQEEESVAYQHTSNIGVVEPDSGFIKWVRVGVVIPDILSPAYGGTRTLKVIVRMVDLNNLPPINKGFGTRGHEGLLWTKTVEFTHYFSEKGYLEASVNRDEATGLSLKIGMAVAMADGSLDDEEGVILQQWIVKSIAPYSDERREYLKNLYNGILKESYDEALTGGLKLSSLTSRLNEIGEKSTKYETLELCFEVMAADGVADTNEMKIIQVVAESLELDLEEVAALRDQAIMGLNANVSDQASVESILGIDPNWSSEQTRKFLRTEFQKWNNRLNTLSDEQERDNAQNMLNLIADARKKYAE